MPSRSQSRSLNTSKAAMLSAWQPAPVKAGSASQGLGAYAYAPPVDLAKYDPAAELFSMGEKSGDKALVKVLAEEIDLLQDKLLADKRYRLLVILQGTDAAGKDAQIVKVTDFAEIAAYGVMSTPGLVVDEKVVSTGKVLSAEEIGRLL